MNKQHQYKLLNASICLLVVLLLGNCGRHPRYPTIEDALRHPPGMLAELATEDTANAHILQRASTPVGIVTLYTWKSKQLGTYGLATTFLTFDHSGWTAQSSGSLTSPIPFVSANEGQDTEQFVAGYTVGGNVTPLSTAFGISTQGKHVRVTWSDAHVDIVLIRDHTFLAPRQTIAHVNQIDVLGDNGEIIQQKRF